LNEKILEVFLFHIIFQKHKALRWSYNSRWGWNEMWSNCNYQFYLQTSGIQLSKNVFGYKKE